MTTRNDVLQAAMHVMRTHGLVRTTTKEIAQAAGVSEGMLYKLFASKTDIFLAVLTEGLLTLTVVDGDPSRLAGTETVESNLMELVAETARFFLITFPIAGPLLSDPQMFELHIREVRSRGTGPEMIAERLSGYLLAEQRLGRVAADAPIDGATRAIAGACLWRAFISRFGGQRGETDGPDDSLAFAEETVRAVLPSLTAGRPTPSRATLGHMA